MNNINNTLINLTILTPYKHTSNALVFRCLKSYYNTFDKTQTYPLHLICTDSQASTKLIEPYLKTLQANYQLLDECNNFCQSIIRLIEQVTTDYFCFVIDDVELLTTKNILKSCIEYLDVSPNVCQVKIGGGFISDGPTNKSNLNFVSNRNIIPNVNPCTNYTPYNLNKNTFWEAPLSHKNIFGHFPLSYWNCIMRTETFHKIHNVIKSRITSKDITWSDYLAKINYSRGISNDIYNKGWPIGLEFISHYWYAWLNFCDYLYPHGRLPTTLQHHKQTHMEEIHD